MASPTNNHGIIVSGHGALTGENIAVGREAKIVYHNHGGAGNALAEIDQHIERLVQLIQAHHSEIDNAGEIIDSVKTVSAELKKEKPNKTIINAITETIAKSVGAIKDVASAATTVHGLVMTFLK